MKRHCCRFAGNKAAGVFVRNIVATNCCRPQRCLVYGGLKIKDTVCKAVGASLGLEAALMQGQEVHVVFMRC